MVEYSEIIKWYENSYNKTIFGLQLTLDDLKLILSNYNFNISEVGKSENNKPILSFKIGTGSKKVLIWTQMHGNESTGTKAVIDYLAFIETSNFNLLKSKLLKELTIQFIPILNPDGAETYTRENAHAIDLNRDAVDLSAKESKCLNSILNEFKPDFCFNLHDQRTIFNVEGTKNPATISFLA
ncbi:MAG: M14 family zinc carboxypeptidase, partial [Flavobacteriaceae bacterium]|nr:M14 family zinc carboxypeptidase [Flavobacteriaceae bacterium]